MSTTKDDAASMCPATMAAPRDVDVCDDGLCVFANELNGTPCTDDGPFCTGVEECIGGACVSRGDPCLGAGKVCNETTDTCED